MNPCPLPKLFTPAPFRWTLRTSFEELDPLGMVHHSRFACYAERATFALLQATGISPEFDPDRYPDLFHVVRDFTIRFLVPLRGVVEFQIHLRVLRLREAGCILAFEIRSADALTLHACGERTIVRLNRVTGAPVGWTPHFRATMEHLALHGFEPSPPIAVDGLASTP